VHISHLFNNWRLPAPVEASSNLRRQITFVTMGSLKVEVKWQKELFKDIEIDTAQPPLVFKVQLFTLTGVPPERQKIMVKGGMLKDDGDWDKLALKPGQRLMMMGTADKVPEAPKDTPVFVEDLPEDEQDTTGGWLSTHHWQVAFPAASVCLAGRSLLLGRARREVLTAMYGFHLVLFCTKNRTVGPNLAVMNRMLISVTKSAPEPCRLGCACLASSSLTYTPSCINNPLMYQCIYPPHV
jgi:hypothetical protein